MKRSLFILLFVFPALFVYSQYDFKMEQYDVQPGFIIKNGKKIDGYIKIKKNIVDFSGQPHNAPWFAQYKIFFVPKNIFENKEKLSQNDFILYKPTDINAYKYGNDFYLSVKLISMGDLNVVPLANKYKFLKLIEDGIFQVFEYYPYLEPPASIQAIKNCNIPEYFYRKGNGKIKYLNSLNVKKEMDDCPSLVKRFKKGAYGYSQPNEYLLLNHDDRTNIRFLVLLDYNHRCQNGELIEN